jgi:hypothetical protein
VRLICEKPGDQSALQHQLNAVRIVRETALIEVTGLLSSAPILRRDLRSPFSEDAPYGQLNTFGFRSSTAINQAEPTTPLAPIPARLETILPVVLPQTLYECVAGHCTSEGLAH